MSKKKTAAKCGKLLAVLGLCASLGVSTVAANAAMMAGQGNYYSDFSTIEELQEAAADLGDQIAEEGITLLKNRNNALPLEGNEWVSVFGVSSDSMIGGSETVAQALENTGFRVNQTLVDYYEATNTSSGGGMPGMGSSEIGNEKTAKDFTQVVKSSLNLYSDVGVIVLARDGAEGSDLKMKTDEVEDNKYKGEAKAAHKDLYTDEDGKEYKHYLQLTESEEELISYVESVCDKVVVVLNTSNVLESADLQNDDEIDGIFWIGRTGDNGLDALGRILNGTVSPSGRTVDIWTADHTADPTWVNYATGEQLDDVKIGGEGDDADELAGDKYFAQDSSGNHNRFYQKVVNEDGTITYREYTRGTNDKSATDGQGGQNPYRSGPDMFEGYAFTMYEEGIYMGYRYYETAAAEAAEGNYSGFDYESAVVYPFGYGLSYTTFEWTYNADQSDLSDWGKTQDAYTNDGTLTVSVTVKNTGNVAGKDVVQVYGHAPYIEGEVEKSEVVLIGYAKTGVIQPGESETVTITVNIQDIASFDDYDKNDNKHATYELDAGSGYELRLQKNSHDLVEAIELAELKEDIILDKDDYSGNTVEALFSETDDASLYEEYNSLGFDPATQKNMQEEGKFKEMTRSSFATTFPDTHTMEEMTRSDEWFAWSMGRDLYVADTSISVAKGTGENGNGVMTIDQFGYDEDESATATNQQPWVVKASEFADGGKYEGWTQAANAEAQKTDSEDWIMYYDMRGIDPYSTETIADGMFKGMTGVQAWEKFMNQLTWEELVIVVSNITEKQLDSVGAPRTPANDSPKNLSSSYDWGDECHIAATFNPDLANKMGTIVGNVSLLKDTGWYGPAMNTHRTAFGGRNNEYYAEDGYLAGTMAAAAVQGAQSKGCATYIKHFAMNDQETGRVRCSSIATEQTARELYLKPFQIAAQEGNSQHLMCSMGSIGDILFGTNYQAMTALLRDEWGFTGMTATDAYSPQVDSWPIDLMNRSGMDAALGDADTKGEGSSASKTYLVSGEWNASEGYLEVNGEASYTQWYNVRNSATRVLYANVNSNYVKNGIDLSAYTDKTLDAATQGVEYEASVALEGLTADTVSYTVQGTLPAGLSLDSATGKISGTPTEAGTSTFTVQLLAENYLTTSAKFTVNVKSAFYLDEGVDTTLEVGEKFFSYINSDTIKLGDDFEKIEYTITEGSLPTGIVLKADGSFEGTATEAGTFNVTIHVKASKESSGGQGGPGGFPGGFPGGGGGFPGGDSSGGNNNSATELDYKLTFVVTGETEEVAPIAISEDGYWVIDGVKTDVKAAAETPTIEIDDETKHWIINGVDTGVVAEGKDGAAGQDGQNGQDGDDGKDGESGGCGGVVAGGSLALAAIVLAGGAALAVALRKRTNK